MDKSKLESFIELISLAKNDLELFQMRVRVWRCIGRMKC